MVNLLKKRNLNTHLKSVHSEKVFKCQQCGSTFNRKYSYQRHLKQHIEKVEPASKKIKLGNDANDMDVAEHSKFKCPKCPATFKEKYNLNKHIKVNHNEHKYSCGECEKTFGLKWVFDNHLKTHEKRKQIEEVTAPPPKKIRQYISDAPETYDIEKSAFNGTLSDKTWFIRGNKDLFSLLKDYKEKIKHSLMLALKKSPLKYYITVKTRFSRTDKDGYKEEQSTYLHGMYHTMLREEQFDETYDSSTQKIWNSFETFIKKGSGWVLERVEKLNLHTMRYEPIIGSSYIDLPEHIKNKKAVINVQNKNNKCFEYSVLAAKHNNEIKEHVNRPETYNKWIGKELNMDGCVEPMCIDHIPRFEKQNQ